MKVLKIFREILFYLNNVIQLLMGLIVILAGIAGIAGGVWLVVYTYNDIGGEWAGIVFIIILPIVIGVAFQILIPMIAFGIVAMFPLVFALARIIVKNRIAKFIFAIVNLVTLFEFSLPSLGISFVGLFVYINIAVSVFGALKEYISEIYSLLILTGVALISILIPLILVSLQVSLLDLTLCVDIIEIYYEIQSKKAEKDLAVKETLDTETAIDIST